MKHNGGGMAAMIVGLHSAKVTSKNGYGVLSQESL